MAQPPGFHGDGGPVGPANGIRQQRNREPAIARDPFRPAARRGAQPLSLCQPQQAELFAKTRQELESSEKGEAPARRQAAAQHEAAQEIRRIGRAHEKSEIAPKAIARRNSVAPAKSAGFWATGAAALVQV